MSIPFIDLKSQYQLIKDDIDEAITSVLDDGRYIMGPAIAAFEKDMVDYSGAKDCISCSSGTDALLIPLMALGVTRNDAVFLPGFTYTATAEVVALLGAEPVFVEVDEKTFNMDTASLEEKILETKNEGRLNPKVVIPVDLFGLPADYDQLMAIADKHGVSVLSDAAQSFGAKYKGTNVGAIAPITATSFFPAKPLGCYGDGGAVMTNDAQLPEILRSIRTHGTGKAKYDVVRIGINGRMDTLQAAILSVKLKIFDEECAKKAELAGKYSEALKDSVTIPFQPEGYESAWAQYVIKVPAGSRDELQARMKEAGCPTQIYYPKPMHFQEAYKQWGKGPGSLPISEKLCDEVLALPMHAYLNDEQFETIVGTINKFFAGQHNSI